MLIPRGPNNFDFLPNWSPDGKTILFNETNGQTLGWLMLFDYEHRDKTEATHLRSGIRANHSGYSPDGFWVVFESVDMFDVNKKGYNIYIMKIEAGNSPIQIEAISPLNFDADWRPLASP